MEQTLGKRISANRKRLGLTQDQLAEKLGVTAQAVSKWENDQSCPDITILPRLAEIFGITTDALLGREPEQAVHQATVVGSPEDTEPDGLHIQNGNWEFKYDNSKRGALGFAVFVLLVGSLLLLSRFFGWDGDLWSIGWPSALLVFGLFGLYPRFSFFRLGCAIFGGYFLVSNLNALPFSLGSEFVLPIILVLFGFSLLVDALRKPKKPRFSFSYDSGKEHKSQYNFDLNSGSFDFSCSFGEQHQYVSMPRLSRGDVSVSFGDYTLDLSGVEEVTDRCKVEASCSFGELTILVPSRYQVRTDSSTSFASLDIKGTPDQQPAGTILLDASVSFGEICVKYI